jgi:DNA invertase Pin-like site-specific DNA recombinase
MMTKIPPDVPDRGTLRGVSPRRPDELPPEVVKRLRAAQANAAGAEDAYHAEVRAALQYGSVRRVAAALGISPTTVQKWSAER